MMSADFSTLGIALGLGLLVGLQRERLHSRIAGIRTFTLITLFGSVSAMIARQFEQDWVIAAGGLSIAILFGIANFLKKDEPQPDIGQTTEIAALLMYAIGAYLVFGSHTVGIVMGAVVALLLYLKAYLGKIVERLGEKDIRAIMLFVAISLVILPLLPDKNFGPYQVLNLREIWLMVVLIVGISIAGYFAYKWLGTTMGTGLNGILGGLISSTATTVTWARQARQSEGFASMAAFVIMAASTVAVLRVLLEVAVVAPAHLRVVAPPLLILALLMSFISLLLFYYNKNQDAYIPEPQNPAQFKTAVVFALIYALILLAIAFVKQQFGQQGLYLLALISGLTDMDAITLSLSNMMTDRQLEASLGWRLIVLATLANLAFKGGIALSLGSKKLTRLLLPAFGLALLGGGLILWLWK
ncbi:MAG: MgtC/SapB family protein [Bacteroidetes bacterium]|nr:MAG: MgtC/SapB family protein [Bacteroidota bacterium]